MKKEWEKLEEPEKSEAQKNKERVQGNSFNDFLKTYNDPINFHKHIGAISHEKIESQIKNLKRMGYGKRSDGKELENLTDDYRRNAILIEKIKTLPGVPSDRSNEEIFKEKRETCEKSPGKYRDIKRYLQAWLYSHNYFDNVQSKKTMYLESDGVILFNKSDSKTMQAKEAYNSEGLSAKRVEYKKNGFFLKSDSLSIWNMKTGQDTLAARGNAVLNGYSTELIKDHTNYESLSKPEKQKSCYDLLRAVGFQYDEAIGILCNYEVESAGTFSANISNGDSDGEALGLPQLRGARRKAIVQFGKEIGLSELDYRTQVLFTAHELITNRTNRGDFFRVNGAQAATYSFMRNYERPTDKKLGGKNDMNRKSKISLIEKNISSTIVSFDFNGGSLFNNKLNQISSNLKTYIFGDSYGVGAFNGYVRNYSEGGESAQNLLQKFKGQINSIPNGSNVVFYAGVNNKGNGNEYEEFCEICKSKEFNPVLCTYPKIPRPDLKDVVITYNDRIRTYAEKNQIKLLDYENQNGITFSNDDQLHPTSKSYSLMKDVAINKLMT